MLRALLLVLFAASLRAAPPSTAFQPDDRWAAVGDSITHSGTYHHWIHLYHVTRFPARALDLANCGISGDTAAGAVRRYAWDIAPHRATVATVMLGMNDVTRALYTAEPPTPEILDKRAAALAAYEKNLRALVATLQTDGARITLITPSIFDQTATLAAPAQLGVNDALGTCAAFIQKLAAETGAAVVDFHGAMTRLNAELQRADPAFTLIGPDRIHPAAPGHFVMAYTFLKAQGAPAEVASLTLDARNATVTHAGNSRATAVRATPAGGLTFTWAEDALPFPLVPAVAPALAWVPFTADFNRELLTVTGLKPGRYELRIDGNVVRSATAAEFAAGLNLALEPNAPQARQALDVAAKLEAHRALVTAELRGIAQFEHQVMGKVPHPITIEQAQPYVAARLEALRKNPPPARSTAQNTEFYLERKARETASRAEAARLAAEARRAARPVPHTYELVPIVAPAT